MVETISVAINDSSDMCFVLTCNKHICKIYKGREMYRRYIQADTLLFICYC